MMKRRTGGQDSLIDNRNKRKLQSLIYRWVFKHELAHPSLNYCRGLLRRRDASFPARPSSSWLSKRPHSTRALCE